MQINWPHFLSRLLPEFPLDLSVLISDYLVEGDGRLDWRTICSQNLRSLPHDLIFVIVEYVLEYDFCWLAFARWQSEIRPWLNNGCVGSFPSCRKAMFYSHLQHDYFSNLNRLDERIWKIEASLEIQKKILTLFKTNWEWAELEWAEFEDELRVFETFLQKDKLSELFIETLHSPRKYKLLGFLLCVTFFLLSRDTGETWWTYLVAIAYLPYAHCLSPTDEEQVGSIVREARNFLATHNI